MRNWTDHLDSVDETYLQHLRHALGFSLRMFAGGIACLVHAIAPFLFESTGSRCIEKLYGRMVVNRRSLTSEAAKGKRRRRRGLESAA